MKTGLARFALASLAFFSLAAVIAAAERWEMVEHFFLGVVTVAIFGSFYLIASLFIDGEGWP